MQRINLGIRTLVCFLFAFLPLQHIDQWTYDQAFRLRGSVSQPTPVVILRVNESSLSRILNLPAPASSTSWNENLWGPILAEIRKENPKLIVFTSYFDSAERPFQDPIRDPQILFAATLNEENQLLPPPSSLTDSNNYGYNNLYPDADNIVRRTRLVYSSSPSIALRSYHRMLGTPVERNLLDPLWIDFRGKSKTVQTIDMVDLFENRPKLKGVFRNKVVIVGRDSSPATDLNTPLGMMSRLEIHANVLDTFLGRRDISILPRSYSILLGLATVLASLALILNLPLTLAWILLLLLSGLLFLSSLLLFSQFKLWLGISNGIFCIFGSHLILLGYRLHQQEEASWKLEQEASFVRELDRFKSNFVSLFSHNLKTPLARIKANLSQLLGPEPSLSGAYTEPIRAIDRTVDELSRSISDILKVTQIDSFQKNLRRDVIDLNRLIENVAQSLHFLSQEKKIPIQLNLEPLFTIEGDSHLLGEVIQNLIENALKYSSSGGPPIVVESRESKGRVYVQVNDQGPGIPSDEIERVTTKFFRGKNAMESTQGTGLGLFLSRYFVELHKGELFIQSRLGQGTQVGFWVPISCT